VQVEHCVTEMSTGIDIVREGIRAAAGEPLSIGQDDVVLRGHAIECRINAEDAARRFAPAPGRISGYREPSGPGVRVDSGVTAGAEVSPMYDPMIAKLIVWDADRELATRRMSRALAEYEIGGLRTLIPFHRALLATGQWARGETCRDLLEDPEWLKSTAPTAPGATTGEDHGAAADAVERAYTVEVSGRRFDVKVIGPPGVNGGGAPAPVTTAARSRPKRTERSGWGASAAGSDTLVSPLQGNVFKILVEEGAVVEEGALVCIIEAMKMENEITAHKAGRISALPISEGASVTAGDTLAVISSAES
jgi:acetyl-CoA/propionyl-CoA/long-chain acyl-CoA carboxylase, biotin carboxylase, biotin carboxyl carrier protein